MLDQEERDLRVQICQPRLYPLIVLTSGQTKFPSYSDLSIYLLTHCNHLPFRQRFCLIFTELAKGGKDNQVLNPKSMSNTYPKYIINWGSVKHRWGCQGDNSVKEYTWISGIYYISSSFSYYIVNQVRICHLWRNYYFTLFPHSYFSYPMNS